MDIFDKHTHAAARHAKLVDLGADPFAMCLAPESPSEARIDGRSTILAGTNNYLGLTFDPECIAAAETALRSYGTGATGSRIANGTYEIHRELEQDLARFLRRRSCIVFTTGYQANLAMIAGLVGPDDTVFIDADCHASVYDGCRLAGATTIRFRHSDPDDLDRRLTRRGDKGGCKLIIVEGLYSMRGDAAPLRDFVAVKGRHRAWLLVDEAHSLGVFGRHGQGMAEALDVAEGVDFVVGTFSKSLGAIGGFGASDHPKFDLLRLCARPYMFTASSSPAVIASVRAALRRIESDPTLRMRLWANAEQLHAGLRALGFAPCAPPGPIIAVPLSDEVAAARAWNRLREIGVYVNLGLPPATPDGLCLLRCSLSAAHSTRQVDEICRRFGVVAPLQTASKPAG
jgi:8-amino-7-oxononanoate synthase